MVFCLLLLNNGQLVGSTDKNIKIWDLERGTCITTLIGHNATVFSLQLKQSGELISASEDNTIKMWNLETSNYIKTLPGHNGGNILVFQDNQLISSSADKTIKLWNLETNTCIQKMIGHKGVVECLNIA